ncbi:MAG: FAD-binding protein [Rhizomicrobium sp.]|nr:FAD-binding protein [Rhizomicrobium sp.]
MAVLVLAEHDNSVLAAATRNTVTAAAQLATGPVHVLVAGQAASAVAAEAARLSGVEKILLADDAAYAYGLAEPLAALLISLAENYDAILAPATTFGKNVLPRAAALLDVAQISDVTAILSPDTFVRPIYAGNALATVQSTDKRKVITVRTTAFAPAADGGAAIIESLSAAIPVPRSQFVGREVTRSERPDLTAARVVVSGGRGLGSKENFLLMEKLADTLGAAIGASRAAVDAGYAPNDAQVGQTGKIVAPDLYIAVGISGAIQHLAGMKDSKVIVAINKDEEAPIFQLADYSLVGDLFVELPKLCALLSGAQG